MRTLTRSLVLGASLALFAGSVAVAASPAKTEWKEIKKDSKTIAKLTKKFEKAIPKGKTDKYVEDIRTFAKGELVEFRAKGVKTKDPKPTHPSEGPSQAPPSNTPYLDKIADNLKDMRDSKNPQKRLAAMKKVSGAYAKWEARLKSKL